jgi:hypothetical protein
MGESSLLRNGKTDISVIFLEEDAVSISVHARTVSRNRAGLSRTAGDRIIKRLE